MALSGSITDFGLADIFQLIGMQRKTGTLELATKGERVQVKFLDGNVVEAQTGSESVEDLLGAVLVRTGKITQTQLKRALKTQRSTLQRLGHILVSQGAITEDELIDGLRVQSLQIIYRLFRWREGDYAFDVANDVEYDQQHFVPIGAETILMEGARMVDEWPLIQRRIRSDEMVLKLSDQGQALDLVTGAPSAELQAFELDMALDASLQGQPAPKEEPQDAEMPRLSDEEKSILKLVDGKNTVQQINDCSPLGEFDTYRILADLITRKLLEEVEIAQARESAAARPLADQAVAALLGLGLVAGLAVAAWTLADNRFAPWRMVPAETTHELRFYAAMSRLDRIERALRVYYLDAAEYPSELYQLAARGYLKPADLLDPWGRPFGYQASRGGYELFGLDAEGARAAELTLSHRFSSAQQLAGPAGSSLRLSTD